MNLSCETATVVPAKLGLVATGSICRSKHLMCYRCPELAGLTVRQTMEQHTYPLGFDLLGVLLALFPSCGLNLGD